MKITVSPEVFRKLPSLKIVFLLVENINNNLGLKQSQHLLKEVERLIHLSFHPETIKNHHLISPWAVAGEEFGSKAKHYHTSLESLLHKVLGRKKIAADNTIINLLNYISLKHLVPMGSDDFNKIKGNILFSISTGKERKGFLQRLPEKEFYYADSKGVLGTKLDFWKDARTLPTPKTTSVLIHLDILPPLNQKKVNVLLEDTNRLIHGFCGGKISIFTLSKKKQSMTI